MKWMIAAVLLFFGLRALAQDDMSAHYKIYDTRLKQIVSTDNIVNAMADAQVLFFGEEHNDSTCHYLENKIFRSLHQRFGNQLALSLEMFESDNQLALNEYLQGFIDESRLSKDARLWSNYKDYRPMVEYARQNQIPVIAANTPRRYVTLVSRRGMQALDSLGKPSKRFLPPLPYDTLEGRYREKFFEVMQGTPGAGSPNIYYSQCLWDAGMSYNIYRFHRENKDKKIFHCVGKFHCEEKLGTAAQLQHRDKKLKILVISSFPDSSFANPDFEKFSSLGDFVIITDPDLKKTF